MPTCNSKKMLKLTKFFRSASQFNMSTGVVINLKGYKVTEYRAPSSKYYNYYRRVFLKNSKIM